MWPSMKYMRPCACNLKYISYSGRALLLKNYLSTVSVECRGGDARGDCLDAPYQILILSSSVGLWWSLLPNIRCLLRHNMTSHSRLQTNVLAKFVDATCIFRDAGAAAGRAVKMLRAMETCKKQKNRYKLCWFLLIITEVIENHSGLSGCPNRCNKFVSSRS